jgi:hypothetical protein
MKTCEWLCGISRILTHIFFLHIPVRKTSSNGIDSDRRDRDKAADLMIVNFLNLFKFFPICSSPYSFFTDTYQFFFRSWLFTIALKSICYFNIIFSVSFFWRYRSIDSSSSWSDLSFLSWAPEVTWRWNAGRQQLY